MVHKKRVQDSLRHAGPTDQGFGSSFATTECLYAGANEGVYLKFPPLDSVLTIYHIQHVSHGVGLPDVVFTT